MSSFFIFQWNLFVIPQFTTMSYADLFIHTANAHYDSKKKSKFCELAFELKINLFFRESFKIYTWAQRWCFFVFVLEKKSFSKAIYWVRPLNNAQKLALKVMIIKLVWFRFTVICKWEGLQISNVGRFNLFFFFHE